MPEQMTKQFAIETLEIFRNDYTREGSAICRAIDIAIDALRQHTIEPEVRLIDANALHAKIYEDSERNYGASANIAQVLLRIETAPTIEPKRGEWVETEPDEDDRKIGIEFSIKCSRCHDENSHLDFNENHEITGKTFWKSRFCPNCGAYMREV